MRLSEPNLGGEGGILERLPCPFRRAVFIRAVMRFFGLNFYELTLFTIFDNISDNAGDNTDFDGGVIKISSYFLIKQIGMSPCT